tara:strand:+ start:387 stop:878 length:492 start_codon:yes stop_codon:yes gene_type:complete
MINKDIERHEQQKNNKENNSNNKVRLEEDSPKNGVLSNEETKGFKKYFIYDTEKISGWKYLIRFFVISLVFVFPTMILKNMEAIFVIILYLCFSYLQSVNAYKRGNALREGWKPMFWGAWGFAVIWISFFLADELKESFWLITGLPHLLLIIINGNKKADPII